MVAGSGTRWPLPADLGVADGHEPPSRFDDHWCGMLYTILQWHAAVVPVLHVSTRR
jgi:hypothetical protein